MSIDLFHAVIQVVVFALGFLSGKAFTMWEANRAAEAQRAAAAAAGVEPPVVKLRGFPVVLSVLVIAFLLMAGLGVQQSRYQHQHDHTQACYSKWAANLTVNLDTRSDANTGLVAAQKRKDEAGDDVFLIAGTLLGRRLTPAQQEQGARELRRALHRFALTKHRVDRAAHQVTTARKAHPFTRPHCG